ncbi:DJ-1 family glyoxalase III [Cephaloticoccus capnophilus]|uniref:DJ-1 family glyoxalase III n=1 Tax=Cephaloticoccus capnophilus TaxID=1548208 RepID=UPI0008392F03|nr:DJ-1 family glyoxalase III [Cephaloticoccus capnophilus]
MAKVLAILTDGFEEIEAVAPIDLLRRAGVEVTIAAVTARETRERGAESLAVTGRCGMVLQAECLLAEALAAGKTPYDCVFLPGGPGVKTLRASALVLDTLRQHHASGRVLAAICAAPLVLLDAGILQGRRYTAHGSVVDELPEILANEAVVVDEGGASDTGAAGSPIVTSRGAGTALEFGLVLVEQLAGRTCAERVAREIHFGHCTPTK